MLSNWNDVATIAVIMTVIALFVGYIVDRLFVSVRLHRLQQQVQTRLYNPTAGVMGETEQMWDMAKYWLELGFTYARMACYAIFVLVPLMIFINIANEGAYMLWNLSFTVLIIIFAVKLGLRWPVFTGVLGLGGFIALLQSSNDDPKDVTVGALKGLGALVKIAGGIVIAVWLLSIVLSLMSWHENPLALMLIVFGFAGYYIFSTIRGYSRLGWLLDLPVIAVFLGAVGYGIALRFGLSLADIENLLLKYNISVGSIATLGLVGVGIYFYFNENEKEGQ